MPLNAQESWRQAVRSLRGGLAAALVFSFALNLLMLAVPLYSMQIYDRVLGSGHVETLLLLSLIADLKCSGKLVIEFGTDTVKAKIPEEGAGNLASIFDSIRRIAIVGGIPR